MLRGRQGRAGADWARLGAGLAVEGGLKSTATIQKPNCLAKQFAIGLRLGWVGWAGVGLVGLGLAWLGWAMAGLGWAKAEPGSWDKGNPGEPSEKNCWARLEMPGLRLTTLGYAGLAKSGGAISASALKSLIAGRFCEL
ncbi:hypothetical protein PPACK8108_LOCUS2482 [Phakopsora pachyrhizi]|uniref:Uncharacterized protein n=1 Tax=Phakopsora pachyrhizi TaxID=170000 RepID=A0AAV0ALW4_PHAPC|nr:hypothetical protein PPACK8108_LOCUS2482 [Phakopsora pachyrhizi]